MSHESLSALLDGECSAEELDQLLDEMERSPELKLSFDRMCLAREAVSGTRIVKAASGLCAGVMARLESLPPEAAHPKVVELAPRRPPFRLNLKPLLGLASAAAVGAVAVLVAMPRASVTANPIGGQIVPAVSAPVSSPLPSRSGGKLRTVANTSAPVPETLQQWPDEDLGGYLIEHSNTIADRGMGGTLSYARYAAHAAAVRSAEYRPPTPAEDPR